MFWGDETRYCSVLVIFPRAAPAVYTCQPNGKVENGDKGEKEIKTTPN